MIIRLLILGILKRHGSAHGYRMYRDLAEWRVETWTVIRPGSIYHALTQMEKQGFITETSPVASKKLGPSKTEYSLSANGEKEFIRLLELALKDINLIELSVGIAFMEYLPRQKVLALLGQRQEAQKQILTFLHTLPTEDVPTTPAKHPELIRVWADSYTDAAANTGKLIQAIQSGKYVFKKREGKGMKAITAVLHDGAKIDIEISGSGPAILFPVNPVPLTGEEAEAKQKWGVDPALGRHFIDGLNDKFTVIAFDYEGFRMQHPAAETLTPDNIVKDFLTVADTAGAEKFAFYGYSWLALCALQLGIRTDRLWALIMGAYPPIDGPYKEMWAVTKATHEMALHPEKQDWPTAQKSDDEYDWDLAELSLSGEQTKQFFTLYNTLQDFDDRAVQSKLTCPRLCFVGSKDVQDYSEKWGGVTVDMATPLIKNTDDLKKFGWDVQVLDGLDHISGMQPMNALPVIKPWLADKAYSL